VSGFLGGGIGAGGAPGHISAFDTGVANAAGGQSMQAMVNRYNQLGLGNSTAEAMDIGAAPSLTGGIPAQFQALSGEIQNNALQNPGSAGKGTSPASLIGGAGSLLSFAGK